MTDTGLKVSVTGQVALFALDRPARRNAVNAQLISAILAALEQYDSDDDVRVIVIAGNGDHFCVGADLDQGAEVFDAAKPGRSGSQRDLGGVLTLRLLGCRKPVIAAAHGIAAGLGATMMLACDLRIAAQGSRFSFPFLARGLCTDACASSLLPRAVGPQTAALWLYTARAISDEEALRTGLLLEITPPEALRARALEIAHEIAGRTSAVAVAYTKQLLARGFGTTRIDEIHREESRFIRYMSKQADLVEGIRSFKEKRPPQFPMKVSTDMPAFFPWWQDADFSDLEASPAQGQPFEMPR
jgi:enoyl-CoA hydratase/carnithine racemase